MTAARILLSYGLRLAFGLVPWILTAVSTRAAAGAGAAGPAFAVTGSVTDTRLPATESRVTAGEHFRIPGGR
jgi:hypothetical protein